ncbi:hypothetical protein GGR56DRAFT_685051 [Xylariaceae sp. FL0804]|nr:hypothetical protein GGR56DRAFT_685051 [Xylariaceae sp. FL0804]
MGRAFANFMARVLAATLTRLPGLPKRKHEHNTKEDRRESTFRLGSTSDAASSEFMPPAWQGLHGAQACPDSTSDAASSGFMPPAWQGLHGAQACSVFPPPVHQTVKEPACITAQGPVPAVRDITTSGRHKEPDPYRRFLITAEDGRRVLQGPPGLSRQAVSINAEGFRSEGVPKAAQTSQAPRAQAVGGLSKLFAAHNARQARQCPQAGSDDECAIASDYSESEEVVLQRPKVYGRRSQRHTQNAAATSSARYSEPGVAWLLATGYRPESEPFFSPAYKKPVEDFHWSVYDDWSHYHDWSHF